MLAGVLGKETMGVKTSIKLINVNYICLCRVTILAETVVHQRYNRGSNQYVNKHVNICCAADCVSECIC